MTEPADPNSADQERINAVWAEARELIKRLEGSSVQRFAVEAGDTRIEIERGIPAGIPATLGIAAPAAAGDDEAPAEDGRHPIKAPLVGTFYRSPQPGADAFVKVGDVVEPGQTIAIVEAMKLMNQVQSDAKGTVAAIVAEDGQWVEFEQTLILLDLESGDED
ncbi:MAG: acetyl-CoA carboxylase biotin carboxyl carrier protein [Gaiellaceae bacterium]